MSAEGPLHQTTLVDPAFRLERALMLPILSAIGGDGRWSPGIGDPTVMGWVTVLAYACGGVLASCAALASHRGARAELAAFWAGVAVLLVVLGVNKQLDLQTWLTETLRHLSLVQGWYEDRRPLQVGFIVLACATGTLGTISIGMRLGRELRGILDGVVGLGFLVSFVLVRAASFHHVDLLPGQGSVRLNWVLELGGLLLLANCALRSSRRAPRIARSSSADAHRTSQ